MRTLIPALTSMLRRVPSHGVLLRSASAPPPAPHIARAGRQQRLAGATAALPALVTLILAASAHAQVQIESGHALDDNLQLGSGGYNGVVYRGGPVSYPMYSVRYGALNQVAPYTNRWRQYSPYTGGAGENWDNNRITNRDVFMTDRSYQAGWQTSNRGYSSYAGPPQGGSSSSGGGGYGGSVGAYRINTRVGG